MSPAEIKQRDMTTYLAHLADGRLSGVSMVRKVAALREYFRYAEAHDILTKSPIAVLRRLDGSATAERT